MPSSVTTPARILLLGGSGQVGFELRRSLALLGKVVAPSRDACDLARPHRLADVLRHFDADVIVNAAGYTAVDAAERDRATAWAVNAESTAVLATFAASSSIPFVHVSSDYVYDGEKGEPYVEDDAPAPLSVYGESKAAGDAAVAAARGAYLIFRAGWIYGVHGNNFVRTILRAAREKDRLQVVTDQWGTPTSAALLADVAAHALHDAMRRGDGAFPSGVYHVAPEGAATWHAYACQVLTYAARQGMPLRVSPDAVEATASAARATPARRPRDTRLDTSKLARTFGLRMPAWQDGVSRLFHQLPRSW
ncbi:dTDP-4-dehydrorhamnose reductase [Cupriavidus plantarum]|nr:dTDP-4-dehydrorhamnose reductase [Cupriavidus plantarum]